MPAASPQVIFNILYIFVNVVVSAYILGTMTVLVVVGDEKVKAYRYATAGAHTGTYTGRHTSTHTSRHTGTHTQVHTCTHRHAHMYTQVPPPFPAQTCLLTHIQASWQAI